MTEQPNDTGNNAPEPRKDDGPMAQPTQQSRFGNGPEPPVGWNQASGNQMPGNQMPGNQMQNGQLPGNQMPSYQREPESRTAEIGKTTFQVSGADAREFESARNFVLGAQVSAIVSIFFGGVLLSTVSIVLALIGRSKLARVAQNVPDEAGRKALMRSGTVAVVIGVLVLALNIISLIVLMPLVMQIAQTGDYSALFGSMPGGGSGPGSTSTWG